MILSEKLHYETWKSKSIMRDERRLCKATEAETETVASTSLIESEYVANV
jgi:hypothetical protein